MNEINLLYTQYRETSLSSIRENHLIRLGIFLDYLSLEEFKERLKSDKDFWLEWGTI